MNKAGRKIVSLFLVATIVFCAIGIGMTNENTFDIAIKAEAAETFIEGYYTYTVDDSGNATITEVDTSISGDVIVPSILGGYMVRSIQYGTFRNCVNIKSVSIPDSVTRIGDQAFQGCSSLVEVELSANLMSLGDSVFRNCNSLESITVNSLNTMYSSDENGVLYNKNKTVLLWYPAGNIKTEFEIPDSVRIIGDYAFYECKQLATIIFSKNVIEIGENAFYDCDNLVEVELFDGVTDIKDNAFGNCDRLKSVVIPSSVVNIKNGAFFHCDALADIVLHDGIYEIAGSAFSYTGYFNDETNWKNGLLYIGNYLMKADDVSGECEIKSGTKAIVSDAFYGCTALTSVTIPETVTSIGYAAFYNCTSLSKITVSKSPERIGCVAFNNTAYYNNPENWEDNFLYLGTCLIDVRLSPEDNIFEIGIKDGTDVLGDFAFALDSEWFDHDLFTSNKKVKINLPASVNNVGLGFSSVYSYIGEICVDENNEHYKSVGGVLFNKDMTELVYYPGGKKAESYTVPSTVKTIGNYAFCSANLYNLYLQNVENIGSMAFASSDAVCFVSRVYMTDSIKKIASDAFNGGDVSGFYTIVCPKDTYAYEYATEHKEARWADSELKEVYFGDCGDTVTWSLDTSTRTLTISGTGIAFLDSPIYEVSDTPWFAYGGYIDSIVIEEGVKGIGPYAFYGIQFRTIDLPDSLLYLGQIHFNAAIESIDLPEGMMYFGGFWNCYNLISLKTPESLEILEDFTHMNMDKLEIGANTKTPSFRDVYINTLSIGEGTKEFDIVAEGVDINNLIIPESVTNITIDESDYNGYYTVKTIYCYKNTYGHRFAVENNIPYVFMGGGENPEEPTTQPTTKPTEPSTKPEETTKPTEPTTTKPVEPSTTKPSTIVDEDLIKKPSTSTIGYGDTLVLHADFKNIPADAKIEWSVVGEGVEIKPSTDGKSCAVTSTSTGDATIIAKYVDEDGTEHVSEQKIESNASFWQKVVSFFKNLFRINRTIEQSLRFC